ncbi:MAG: Mth938-like domain-containing protein [Marinicellaceae bacterium]
MQLIENKETISYLVKTVNDDSLVINTDEFYETCIISNENLMTDLHVNSIDDLTSQHIEYLLASNPEIVIIGSGIQHEFPDVNLLHPIAQLEIGFEVMNNKSASRTYNVLVAEERKVACLLIIDAKK